MIDGLPIGEKNDREIIIWNDLDVFKKDQYQCINKKECVDKSCEIKIKMMINKITLESRSNLICIAQSAPLHVLHFCTLASQRVLLLFK